MPYHISRNAYYVYSFKLYMNRYFHFPIFTVIEYSLEPMNVQLGVCPVVIFHKICWHRLHIRKARENIINEIISLITCMIIQLHWIELFLDHWGKNQWSWQDVQLNHCPFNIPLTILFCVTFGKLKKIYCISITLKLCSGIFSIKYFSTI